MGLGYFNPAGLGMNWLPNCAEAREALRRRRMGRCMFGLNWFSLLFVFFLSVLICIDAGRRLVVGCCR